MLWYRSILIFLVQQLIISFSRLLVPNFSCLTCFVLCRFPLSVVHVIGIHEVCVAVFPAIAVVAPCSCHCRRAGPDQHRSIVISGFQIIWCPVLSPYLAERVAARSCGPNLPTVGGPGTSTTRVAKTSDADTSSSWRDLPLQQDLMDSVGVVWRMPPDIGTWQRRNIVK